MRAGERAPFQRSLALAAPTLSEGSLEVWVDYPLVDQNRRGNLSIRAAALLPSPKADRLFEKGALRQVLVAGLYPYRPTVHQAFRVLVSIDRRQL